MGREPQVEELAPQRPPRQHPGCGGEAHGLERPHACTCGCDSDVVLAQESCATQLEVEAEARFSGYAAAVG